MTFERSTDYALIREILVEPRCYRRMTGVRSQESGVRIELDVGPRDGIEFVLARADDGAPTAVFLIVAGVDVHFCFVPAFWGRTEATARGFIAWCWAETVYKLLHGHVPVHNRLALQLAQRVGFTEYGRTSEHVLLEIRKPK
jgi:hypothetical protein